MKHAIRQEPMGRTLVFVPFQLLRGLVGRAGSQLARRRRRAVVSDWLLQDVGLQGLTDRELGEIGISRSGNGRWPLWPFKGDPSDAEKETGR